MKTLLIATVISAGTLFTTPVLAAQNQPKELLTLVDISRSSPVTVDEALAKRFGHVLFNTISHMRKNDIVKFRVLGAYGANEQDTIAYDVTLGRKARPKHVAKRLGSYIATMPEKVSAGKIEAGGSTHILDTMVELSSGLNCQERDTTILLFTDGIETGSEGTKINTKKGVFLLPDYGAGHFKGCHLKLYGLGRTKPKSSARLTRALRKGWMQWGQMAGFKSVKLFSNW